jgi:hypothetical protein
MKGKRMNEIRPEKQPFTNPEIEGGINQWLEVIDQESLLPIINRGLIKDALELAISDRVPPKFILTLCPAFENINSENQSANSDSRPTRRILPFEERNLSRPPMFAKEIAALIIGTKEALGISPRILLIINDIFEPEAEKRLANLPEANEILVRAKRFFHQLFQKVDETNPEIWPHKIQKSIKIILQSDFLKPLQRFALPDHRTLVEAIMRETLDPQTDAFQNWLRFLKNTRDDPLMSSNAWLTSSGASTIHQRVRFLVAMYWVDGLVNPLLFKTIFVPKPEQRRLERQSSPIFICGVTRELQASMEMGGVNFHLGQSSINELGKIQDRELIVPRPAIHVIRNTAMWTEDALEPFTFGGKIILK